MLNRHLCFGSITLLQRLHLVNNVGQFHQHTGDTSTDFGKLTLVYADNGRGKTTISCILRSLGGNLPVVIQERKRLGGTGEPHVVVHRPAGTPPCVFQAGAWQGTPPTLLVFDDFFIEANVYSGLSVTPVHRQCLHEVVVGAQGVTLAKAVDDLTTEIRGLTDRVTAATREVQRHIPGTTTVDAFLILPQDPAADDSIAALQQRIRAVQESEPVRQTSLFDTIAIEGLDPGALNTLLPRALRDLDADAAGQVRAHVSALGAQGERWIVSGVERAALPAMHDHNLCPLCAQSLDGSPLFAHYRSYFSQAYTDLKAAIEAALTLVETTVGDGTLLRLQQACRVAEQRRDFWTRFTALPAGALPLDTLMAAARTAREAMLAALRAKQAAPLDAQTASAELGAAIAAYNAAAEALHIAIEALRACNPAIEEVKRGVGTMSEQTLTEQLNRLLAIKARFTAEAAAACTTLTQERAAKIAAETRKEAARTALDRYRDRVFPQYTTAINRILISFNAGFQIELQAENPGGRPSTGYHVLINNAQVPLNLPAGRPPGPSFRTALSAGDRATLALAFFFASLESHPQLANAIIVLDDPVSSLDDYRAGTTATKIKTLLGQTTQVVVLCHSKAFLCQFWEDDQIRPYIAPLRIERCNPGSKLERWDMQAERLTEHDRRQELLQAFLDAATTVDKRKVAEGIRPHLEAFCRVAFPEVAKPGKLLGPIVNELRQRVGQPSAILDLAGCDELEQLKDYGNKFHHDGSAAWTPPAVIDQELEGFVRRTLRFIRRS